MTRRGGTIGMAADPARQRDRDRRPYTPPKEEWEATWQMLCGHCAHAAGCQVVEAMIAHANGDGPWPEGGWVTDPGAEVTCLSYEPGTRPPMPRQQRRAIARMREAELPSVCPGCAAGKGSEASVSLHTRRDYQAAVRNGNPFLCHDRLPADPRRPATHNLCGGWCRAIKAKKGKRS